ncbi:MAG: cytochrome c3 family protein [Candidatus Xenobia bacterium]
MFVFGGVGTVVAAILFVIVYFAIYPTKAQPIFFQHRLHAGTRQIQCVYCHTGAREGDMAGVPSVQDCYQCHQVVKNPNWTAKQQGEVQKVIDHYKNSQQITWFKVYNMPKHVHFSHRAHFVGGIQCEQCHGDLTQMDTARMANNFTMGFCLKCHRQHLDKNPMLTDCATCHY